MRIFLYALALSFVTATNVTADEYCDPKFLMNDPIMFQIKSNNQNEENNELKFLVITKRQGTNYSYKILNQGDYSRETDIVNTFSLSPQIKYSRNIQEFNLYDKNKFSITRTINDEKENPISQDELTLQPIGETEYQLGFCRYKVVTVKKIIKHLKTNIEDFFTELIEPNTGLVFFSENLKNSKQNVFITSAEYDLAKLGSDFLSLKNPIKIKEILAIIEPYAKNGSKYSQLASAILLSKLDNEESKKLLLQYLEVLYKKFSIPEIEKFLYNDYKNEEDRDDILIAFYESFDSIGVAGIKIKISEIYGDKTSKKYNIELSKNWLDKANTEFLKIDQSKKITNINAEYLGNIFSEGLFNQKKDISKAVDYFYIAAAQNTVTARDWLIRQAETGNNEASFALGKLYEYGSENFKAIPEESYKWYEKSANDGNAQAMYKMTKIYAFNITNKAGEIDKLMLDNYIKYLGNAAEKNNNKAQEQLANEYLYGLYRQRDQKKALYWYKKALIGFLRSSPDYDIVKDNKFTADYNYKNSLSSIMRQIGIIIEYGNEKEKFIEAYKWYLLSKNVREEKEILRDIEEIQYKLTNDQIIIAKEKAEQCETNNFKNCYPLD